ncbi:hypothetical protein [Aureimonas populi]|uniref:Uncharacterized protein n=1 Tax=Aureimonas populi TaxID=1701758 RepID=A0ABW5CSY3_9HYPH|nr:hypothetical protein [Aureimonas populi]
MATIRERLKLRFGLPLSPSADDIADWEDRIRLHVASGMQPNGFVKLHS